MRLLMYFMWLTMFQVIFWICLLVGELLAPLAAKLGNYLKYRNFLFSFLSWSFTLFIFKYLAVLFYINCEEQAHFLKGLQ